MFVQVFNYLYLWYTFGEKSCLVKMKLNFAQILVRNQHYFASFGQGQSEVPMDSHQVVGWPILTHLRYKKNVGLPRSPRAEAIMYWRFCKLIVEPYAISAC